MKCFPFFVLAAATALPGQVADYANNGYKTAEGRARVAGTLTAHDREQTQKPRELVEALELKPGMSVADIGTGVGFMLPYLRDAVGAEGRIFAEDIFPDFLEKAKARAQEKQLGNVTFIHGTVKDSQLPAASVDLALVLDVYHHFDYPAEMLSSIAKGLKPGGRLVIVDFYKAGFRDPQHIRLDEKEMIAEVESHGFRLRKSGPFTPDRQYLATFEKK
ncbi:MAG: methyltransferase domain-containing protein [Bryobacterales bacterium]|nr:methyltransferase domain-containing protein [Bryobacterales bacterium]